MKVTGKLLNRSSPSAFRRTLPAADGEHVRFIKEVAAAEPPKHLPHLVNILRERGETILSPRSRNEMIPLVIPLARSCMGTLTALLRWSTAPTGMEMPVVEVQKHGVCVLAKNVDQFIQRILVEEDALGSLECNSKLYDASAEAGKELYTKGDLAKSKLPTIDAYLLKKVGLFPDVLESKAIQHIEKGDHATALVMAEFYTKRANFPGFARPFVFNAEVLLRVGRRDEAKDAARGALKLPWWTLGCEYKDVAKIAQWGDERIEYIKNKLTEEGREEDLMKGKPPSQIALDNAAFLLDLGSVDGTWDDSLERIAECYATAGLDDIARFVLYKE